MDHWLRTLIDLTKITEDARSSAVEDIRRSVRDGWSLGSLHSQLVSAGQFRRNEMIVFCEGLGSVRWAMCVCPSMARILASG